MLSITHEILGRLKYKEVRNQNKTWVELREKSSFLKEYIHRHYSQSDKELLYRHYQLEKFINNQYIDIGYSDHKISGALTGKEVLKRLYNIRES